jgi:S-adenosyl-L-methionine hydrolase (adenosine-forming)
VRDPVITFLSDYGLNDEFVGTCHGVIARVCPAARVIDLTHGVPRQDVRAGALVLAAALPYLPVGVHLAVVDPGVGGERRAVAAKLGDGRVLVGPDNGLLSLAATVGGGCVAAVDIGDSPFRLQPVSPTFHGRDIFAPVAARIASGAALSECGSPVDPGGLLTLELPHPEVLDGVLIAHVIYVDAFGNVQLDAGREEMARAGVNPGVEVVISTGAEPRVPVPARYARTFTDVPPAELVIYEDSARRLAIAVNQGAAAAQLGVGSGAEVRISL